MTRFTPLVTVAWLLFVASIAWADSIPQIVARVKPSVVTIVTLDQSHRQICTGTGFCIDEVLWTDDLRARLPFREAFVTNKHVVVGTDEAAGRYYTAITSDGTKLPETDKVIADTKYDLALVFFKSPKDVPQLATDYGALVEGQRVIVIGSPLGLSGTVSDGIISAFRNGGEVIQITAPISPGSSGSPVLNEDGKVIGVAFGGYEGGQNLNFCLSIKYIHAIYSEYIQTLWRFAPGDWRTNTDP